MGRNLGLLGLQGTGSNSVIPVELYPTRDLEVLRPGKGHRLLEVKSLVAITCSPCWASGVMRHRVPRGRQYITDEVARGSACGSLLVGADDLLPRGVPTRVHLPAHISP